MKHSTFTIIASSVISTIALASAHFAQASEGGDNINGVAGRLETITCHGAYVSSSPAVEEQISKAMEAQCDAINDSEAFENCMKKVVMQYAQPDTDAHFTGAAIAGQKTFQMSITEGGKTLFSSLRRGLHGDNADGSITLMFPRTTGQGSDEDVIQGGFAGDNDHLSSLIVPVSDQGYFFLNGCTLSWTGLED